LEAEPTSVSVDRCSIGATGSGFVCFSTGKATIHHRLAKVRKEAARIVLCGKLNLVLWFLEDYL